jgi:hypothetical protein
LDPGLLTKSNRSCKPPSSRITSISELTQFSINTALVLQDSVLDTDDHDDDDDSSQDLQKSPTKQPSHRQNTPDFNSSMASLDPGLLMKSSRSCKPPSSRIASISELDTAELEDADTDTDEDDDDEGALDVPMMPIVQYTSSTPKSAKRTNPGSSTTKEKQGINPGTSETKKESKINRRSTSRRPARLEAKPSTASEDRNKSPIRSPQRKSWLHKTVLKSKSTKEDSQTSGEPTDEMTNRGPKSYVPRLHQPGEKEKAQERKQTVNEGLDKFLQMVADNGPVSKIKDENRSVYSAIPEVERIRKMAKSKSKQRGKPVSQRRGDSDPNNDLETSDLNMSVGSMPAMDGHKANTSSSSGMDHRPVISVRKTHFSKKLRNLDLAF